MNQLKRDVARILIGQNANNVNEIKMMTHFNLPIATEEGLVEIEEQIKNVDALNDLVIIL